MDEYLGKAVKDRSQDVTEYLRKKGIMSLKEAAMTLYMTGETSYEEIISLLNDDL